MPAYDGFYDAATARNIASGGAGSNSVVLAEINALQVAIDTAASANSLTTTVVGTTTMTSYDDYNGVGTSSYFDAWTDPGVYKDDIHRLDRERMARVVNYFTRLGYNITRTRDDTNDRFKWVIEW